MKHNSRAEIRDHLQCYLEDKSIRLRLLSELQVIDVTADSLLEKWCGTGSVGG
jgi:hypothetical protein